MKKIDSKLSFFRQFTQHESTIPCSATRQPTSAAHQSALPIGDRLWDHWKGPRIDATAWTPSPAPKAVGWLTVKTSDNDFVEQRLCLADVCVLTEHQTTDMKAWGADSDNIFVLEITPNNCLMTKRPPSRSRISKRPGAHRHAAVTNSRAPSFNHNAVATKEPGVAKRTPGPLLGDRPNPPKCREHGFLSGTGAISSVTLRQAGPGPS